MRLAFALLALLALPTVAAAEPDRKGLTFSGGLEAGSFATEVTGGDDSPSGRSVGAWVAGGQFLTRRLALVLQLRWTTMRDAKIEDPFDEPSSDVRTTWLEGAAAIQGYVLPRSEERRGGEEG